MTDKPAAAELSDFTTVTEGKATILFPKDQVFYNPAQQFNRDLSVAVIRTWSESLITKAQLRKIAWEQRQATSQPSDPETPQIPSSNGDFKPQRKITILEALSATGLRSLRYALEIPAIRTVLANDVAPSAIQAIHRNIAHNNLPANLVQATCSDANALMYSHHTDRVDVVDLDPYGTATPFIDAAIQAIASDGLLCVTCTDMSVLAGIGYPEKCFANYGGSPVKQEYTHEVALRLVLNMIAMTAAKYGRTIEPLLCLSVDFYVRLFVRVVGSPAQVKYLASKTMITYNCQDCGSWSNQYMGRTTVKGDNTKFQLVPGPSTDINCPHCGGKQHLAGPMWAGPLHNRQFVEKVQETVESLDESVYKTKARIKGFLTLAAEELDVPLYRTPQEMSSRLRTQTPPLDLVWSALKNAGYNVSSTHCCAGAFKTDAPLTVVWDMMKAWVKDHPVKQERLEAVNTPAARILAIPATYLALPLSRTHGSVDVDLTLRADVNPNRTKITRFVQVPPNWGPGTKAGKKEGRSWRGKRKRDASDEGSEMNLEGQGVGGEDGRETPSTVTTV